MSAPSPPSPVASDPAEEKIVHRRTLPLADAAALVRDLAKGLRRGTFVVRSAGRSLRLRPRGDLHVDLRLHEGVGEGGRLRLEISWWFVPTEGT